MAIRTAPSARRVRDASGRGNTQRRGGWGDPGTVSQRAITGGFTGPSPGCNRPGPAGGRGSRMGRIPSPAGRRAGRPARRSGQTRRTRRPATTNGTRGIQPSCSSALRLRSGSLASSSNWSPVIEGSLATGGSRGRGEAPRGGLRTGDIRAGRPHRHPLTLVASTSIPVCRVNSTPRPMMCKRNTLFFGNKGTTRAGIIGTPHPANIHKLRFHNIVVRFTPRVLPCCILRPRSSASAFPSR